MSRLLTDFVGAHLDSIKATRRPCSFTSLLSEEFQSCDELTKYMLSKANSHKSKCAAAIDSIAGSHFAFVRAVVSLSESGREFLDDIVAAR